MSGPSFFVGNSWFTFWDSEDEGNLPQKRVDGTPLRALDCLIDLKSGTVRQYQTYSPPGFTGWQPCGVVGDSQGDPINFGEDVQFNIIDQQGTATAYPTLSFQCLNGALVTPTAKYTIVMNNDILYFKQGDITGSNVMTFDAAGNVKIWNNLEVVGDIVLDDITTDVITLKDRIQHDGNTTTYIGYDTDKITIDASGTSIVMDDAAMTNQIVVTGSTQFVNNIEDVPDIYLRNHVHHYADVNTRMGFPANDQIALRTGGTDRVLVTDASTTIGPEIRISDGLPRLKANMTGTPVNTRFAIQNSTLNGNSRMYMIPNGTGNISAINMRNDSAFDDTLPFQSADIGIVGGEMRLTANGANGSSTPPITFRPGAAETVRFTDTASTISTSLILNATQPRIIANMNGGTWDTRLIMQTSNANASSKLYVLPSTTAGLTQAGSAVFSNIGNLNAASYNLYEVGQYPTECRNWSTAASGDPLPFSWRFGGSAAESMRLVRTGTAAYPADYDVLLVGDGVTADGGASIAQQGIIIKQRGQIQWNASPADGGPAITMFRATNSADLVLSKGWRNSNTSGTAWESSATTTTARTALQLSSGSINFFVNPSQAGTAGSAAGVTPQQIMSLSQTSTVTSQNSATTVVYQQSLGGITPSNPIIIDVDIGRSNSNYAANIDSATYIANQSWWNNSVARGFNLNGTLYAASLTNLSQSGLVCTITGVSASVLRFTFTDTSGVGSTKVGTARITVTSSN